MSFHFLHRSPDEQRIKDLHGVSLFRTLTARELREMDELLHERSYQKDEVIFDEGDAGLGLFMVVPSGAAWVALLLLLGAGVSGSQLSLNALSAAYYPPAIKATGVAWALLVGGMGSVVAPLAGAWMLQQHLSTIAILGLLAIPALINAAAVGLMRQEWQAH